MKHKCANYCHGSLNYDRKGSVTTLPLHKMLSNAEAHGKSSNYLFLGMSGMHEEKDAHPREPLMVLDFSTYCVHHGS